MNRIKLFLYHYSTPSFKLTHEVHPFISFYDNKYMNMFHYYLQRTFLFLCCAVRESVFCCRLIVFVSVESFLLNTKDVILLFLIFLLCAFQNVFFNLLLKLFSYLFVCVWIFLLMYFSMSSIFLVVKMQKNKVKTSS
jgi:hypothetical protein